VAQAKKYVYQEDEYNASLKAWEALKSKAYTYTITEHLMNGRDTRARTTIKVRNGQVVSRKYLETNIFHYPEVVVSSWSETTPEAIGSHEEGYPVRTFDEVYAQCLTLLTQNENPDKAYVLSDGTPDYFGRVEVDANGLLSLCGFYRDYGTSGWLVNVESIKYC